MRTSSASLAAAYATLASLLFPQPGRAQSPQPYRPDTARLVATARHAGLTAQGYPVGILSPDGRFIAVGIGRRLEVHATGGGAPRMLGDDDPLGKGALAWLPDARRFVARSTPRFGRGPSTWRVHDAVSGRSAPLWPGHDTLVTPRDTAARVPLGRLTQLVWAPGGERVAGIVPEGARGTSAVTRLWLLDTLGAPRDVRTVRGVVTALAWHVDGRTVACVVQADGRRRFARACGDVPDTTWTHDPWGAIALSADAVHYAAPDTAGPPDDRRVVLSVWRRPLAGGAPTRLARFARDAYVAGLDAAGHLLVRETDARATVWVVTRAGGRPRQLTRFFGSAEGWHPSGRALGVTFGDWRRYDAPDRYPDVQQDLGLVHVPPPGARAVPAAAPQRVVLATETEDQGMAWSPDGRWIALHSHMSDGTRPRSDDVFLMPADGSQPPRMVSRGGWETGRAAWRSDGRAIVYGTRVDGGGGAFRNVLHVVDVDPVTGATTPPREVRLPSLPGVLVGAIWVPGTDRLLLDVAEEGGHKMLLEVPDSGGTPRIVRRYASDQFVSGRAASPDGRDVVFVARTSDGWHQLVRAPIAGVPSTPATQVTRDPGQKSTPAWSPDGRRIAYTVLRNDARFRLLRAGAGDRSTAPVSGPRVPGGDSPPRRRGGRT